MHKRKFLIPGLIIFLLIGSALFAQKAEPLPRVMLPSGTGDNEVRNVKAIHVGLGGDLYIGSARNNKVQVFDKNGQFLHSIPAHGKKDIDVAYDIDVGPEGEIYIVDRDREEIVVFNKEGMRTGKIGDKKIFDKPLSVSLSRDKKVYVADEDKKKVFIFNSSGQNLGFIQSGGMEKPIAVDVDHSGRVFVLDKDQKSVFVFDKSNTFLAQVKISFAGEEAKEPIDICVNPDGQVFVLDEDNKVFYFLEDFNNPEWSAPYGGDFEKPIAIDVQGKDVCYVLDNNSGEEMVWKYKLDIVKKAVTTVVEEEGTQLEISTNIDTVSYIKINQILPEESKIILTVFEKGQKTVSGLISTNFTEAGVSGKEISVEKTENFISQSKIDFILLVGTEGLKQKDIEVIQDKISREFLPKLDESRHRVSIFTFANDPVMALPLEKSFSKQKSAVGKLAFNGEKPKLYDALVNAIIYHDSLDTKNYPVFLVITNSDGSASRDKFSKLEEFRDSMGIPQIHVIGYDPKSSEKKIEGWKKIADLSGGFSYSANQISSMDFMLRRTVTLLRNQYILTTSNIADEGTLNLGVDIDLDGHVIRAEKEYKKPTGGKPAPSGPGFFEKYWLIIVIVLAVIILLMIIIVIIKGAKEKSKAPLGEARLELKSGDAPQKTFRLRKGANKIGSRKENDIVLSSEGISGNHAVIEYAGGKYEIIDSESTNGTFVNRNRITRRTLINGDTISIASVVDFEFKSG